MRANRQALRVGVGGPVGSGKTALLEATADALGDDLRIAVIEGDLETENDAERIRSKGVPAVQISTGSACHLDAHMVHTALHELDLDGVDVLFIENVGNLVCPASFDLGQHCNVALLSTPEGDDKPAKYPVMFRAADLVEPERNPRGEVVLRHAQHDLAVRHGPRFLDRRLDLRLRRIRGLDSPELGAAGVETHRPQLGDGLATAPPLGRVEVDAAAAERAVAGAARRAVRLPVLDTQCGFKLFRRDCARELFADLNESGWAFDVEVLYRAQLTGYGIAEVAVDWHEVDGSKVSPVRDAIRMFIAVFRIRRNNAGFLRRPAETGADSLGYAAGLSQPERMQVSQ